MNECICHFHMLKAVILITYCIVQNNVLKRKYLYKVLPTAKSVLLFCEVLC